jgi:hypothetical protein
MKRAYKKGARRKPAHGKSKSREVHNQLASGREFARKYADTFPRSGKVTLPSELHRHVRARDHMGSRHGSLLPRQAAAYGFQFKAGGLRGFHCAAHCLPSKRRHFDSALLDIQDYGASRW